MDELTAEMRARTFLRSFKDLGYPAPLDAYLKHVNAVLEEDDSLAPGEDGYTMSHKGRHKITVNARQSEKRRRFTVCHEIAHIVLDLPSNHAGSAGTYEGRPLNEVCCDVFAAELLLPFHIFRMEMEGNDLNFKNLSALSDTFSASLFATGSRAVAMSRDLAAFVISHAGVIKYAFRSPGLRQANIWVRRGERLPADSHSQAMRAGTTMDGPVEHDADIWFEAKKGSSVYEEAVHDSGRDMTLTLLVCDADDVPERVKDEERRVTEEDELLQELDGVLRFRGKKG